MTKVQKQCLLFLYLSYLSNRTCLIKGPSASGKSKLLPILKEILGKNLHVYQMNQDTNITIFTGQNIINQHLNESEIEKLESFKNSIVDLFRNDSYIIKLLEKFSILKFEKLIKYIESLNRSDNQIIELLIKLKQFKNEIINLPLINRLNLEKNQFEEALINGDFILIDGLELARTQIMEKITGLCEKNKYLNIYEKNYNISQNINKDFSLFITYNSFIDNDNLSYYKYFLDNCLTFTLPELDSDIEYSSQMIFGTLIYYYNFQRNLAKKCEF